MAEFYGIPTVVITYADGTTLSISQLVAVTDAIYATTKDLDMDAPGRDKYIDRIIFDFEAEQTPPQFTAQLGYRDSLRNDVPVTWLDPETITPERNYLTPRVTAKFFRLKLSDSLPIAQWKCSRIEFYGQVMNGRFN